MKPAAWQMQYSEAEKWATEPDKFVFLKPMTLHKPFLYAFFFAGIAACTDRPAKPPETTPVKTDTVASFTWQTELCEHTANYNPQKYSEEQLKNTFDLWFALSGLQLETEQSVYKPADISKLDLKKLTGEYEKKKERYRHMPVVNLPYWIKLKEQRMRELDDQYELAKLSIQAFSDPSVLANNRFAQSCKQYVTALTAQDTSVLFSTWKAFAEEQKMKNGSPDQYMASFYEKYNSPEKLSYAMVDLITFAWGNCANGTLTHVNRDEEPEAEFDKLFTNIKTVCDEP